jgi:tetratricopeptide (TPR) repeat protein
MNTMKTICILLCSLFFMVNLYSQDKDQSTWWIYNYGDYSKTKGEHDPRVKRAIAVFKKVKNAAEKTGARMPVLYFINARDRDKPLAIAVPDGGVIINPKILDLCYGKGNDADGDRGLAFILGHELAHLANRDFFHREAFFTLNKYGSKDARQNISKYFKSSPQGQVKESKKKELLADQKGAIYAAMAGYDMGSLFEKKSDFLRRWAREVGSQYYRQDTGRYPSMGKRVQFVQAQLSAVVNQIELFNAGILLFQKGSYQDAKAAFIEFVKLFPGREVLNNIGSCYLNLALRRLEQKYSNIYFRFRLSTAIDYSSSVTALKFRGDEDYLKDNIIGYLDKAEYYFTQAAEKDKLDAACRYNLSATLILKKKFSKAQAYCEEILAHNKTDSHALNNFAIAFYYYGKKMQMDTTQKAIKMLQKVHDTESKNQEVLYNLAALKQERNRLAGAKAFWEKYIQLPVTQLDGFYEYAYEKRMGTKPPQRLLNNRVPPMPTNIKPGQQLADIEKRWGKDHTRTFRMSSEEGENEGSFLIDLQVISKDNTRVLAIDDTVEIIEQEFKTGQEMGRLLRRYGAPQRVIHHNIGNFYVYEKRGFSIKEIKGKARAFIWFDKPL